jgi:acetyl-CoA carboxylase biotin carboxyl carrier protein
MSGLTRQDIDDILALVDKSNFDELRLEMGDTKIELRRRGATVAPSDAPAPHSAPAPTQMTPVETALAAPNVAAPIVASGGGTKIPAPLLGTFYLSPKPGADPFIKLGDRVAPDTVIGIIEVMKLMNSVTAGLTGTVTAIHAVDGSLVEHGEPLISVQPE